MYYVKSRIKDSEASQGKKQSLFNTKETSGEAMSMAGEVEH